MKHPILRKMIPAGMVMVLLAGCGEKKVDYEMETEQETKGVVGTLDEFREADNWDDSFTVTTSDGDVKVRINASIDVPEADAMSVVAAEELKIDVDYKKKFLKAYFKDSEIYYHDVEHLTKEELQTAVDSMDGTIVAVQSQIDDLENNAHHQDVERHKEMLNDWKEETEEQKKQYEKALETAKDTYTAAEDYDSCNEYAGYCGDLLCNVRFEVKETNENAIAYIVASPLVQGKSDIYVNQYYGPQSLKDCDYIDGYNSVNASIDKTESENECSISRDDAKQLVEQFLKETGRDNQVLYGLKNYTWYGANVTEQDGEEFVDSEASEVRNWGYLFGYGTGVNGLAFSDSLDYNDFDISWVTLENSDVNFELEDEIRFAVTDNGITEVFMQYPVSVTKISKEVELLPLSTIQNIIKDEIIKNGDDYQLDECKSFNKLKLGYARIKDDQKEGCYSYVPAWCLYMASGNDMNRHPVFVNAMDGTLIHPLDER